VRRVLEIGCRQQLIRSDFAKQPRRPSWNAKQMFSNILGMSCIAVCNQISAQGTKCFATVGSAKKAWWTPSFALAIGARELQRHGTKTKLRGP
jgi:hypothetical protein